MDRTIPVFNRGLRELFPLYCGFEDCENGHAFGPAVREHYLIHYIRSGKGTFSCAGAEYTVTKGQCFLICPKEITYYKADDSDPWQYTWLAFSGENARALLHAAGLGKANPILQGIRVSALFESLHESILHQELSAAINEYYLLSILYALFAALPQLSPAESPKKLYIEKACNYISKMYTDPISVVQLAAYCGLDRRYLCRIFKSETGSTLQQYIIRLRMRKARNLLISSPLSVGDVARSVGYTDLYNFSKMFKKQFGLSPRAFRAEDPVEETDTAPRLISAGKI